jgi:DNA-directed RNA polymerase subunit H (RpoH/RPB5)
MSTNNATSSLISSIYNSRKTVLKHMKLLDYDIKDYDNFSVNEVNTMFQSKQLDMLLEKKEQNPKTNRHDKIYIRYYLAKSIRPQNIQEMLDDLFQMEEILTKNDTLYIIIKDDMNETLKELLKHIWEQDGIFIVMQNIKRLQFNILEHSLVPPHRIIKNEEEIKEIKDRYNITNENQFPDISRFDPVAQVICIRPGQICQITRPSKTAIKAMYYRICS